MRIGRQAAKFYVTDEVISGMADQILGIDKAGSEPNVISLAAERPNAADDTKANPSRL
jgi:hypothetical protein